MIGIDNNIVGADIGIFHILEEMPYKANDGHKLYHVKCNVCGWESKRKTMSGIKYVTSCQHKRTKWENKRISQAYRSMKERCCNPKDKDYRFYGEKGIKICDEWLNNPKSFEDWALNNGYDENLTIDRIDSSKDYSTENCRWITLEANARYKSTTKELEVDGNIKTGREWANYLGIGTNKINIIRREYGEEKAKDFISWAMNNKEKLKEKHYFKEYIGIPDC